MISGQMYYHKEPRKTIQEIVKLLIDTYHPKNVKYVLVHHRYLEKEISHSGIKIKPQRGVLPNHFWFVSENNIENQPNYGNFEKIT
jgi:hypothetical protein